MAFCVIPMIAVASVNVISKAIGLLAQRKDAWPILV